MKYSSSRTVTATDAFAPDGLLLVGGVVVVGVLLVVAASAASRPLLRSVTTGAAREDRPAPRVGQLRSVSTKTGIGRSVLRW
ncbi:hypothetical protein I4I73_19955 [Pseudonocardia sp. KRD-184]|uniref:Uncharacterized protein n=1 Tax=Pseudonocardia oceani TaxID=2792013 RepID=A0ABS6U7T5_9PSEU|nr:hypothetical protein [Pseudonocardia oceani]MBW0091184.1 hypothetical protein [Pseudonocardia oceani]MBW0098263.1 hypothetical protein [Pseudonocardia oceani]MBW0110862.1 hypothetical protein [Pseudonocardia oceani]MBW0122855.1 hypothetical protein [Pseudonocardia oceani]MBW0128273.1 hypothetical protein [Pseudonocardia oceani]